MTTKINIVSYSGGMGSAITADLVIKTYGVDNTILVFADTKIEDEDLYRFNNDVVNKLGCIFVTICDGRDVWDVFEDVKYIGNGRVDPCSRVLKRDLIKNYICKNFDATEVDIWLGIDCSEEHRLDRIKARNDILNYRSILVENNIFVDDTYKKIWCLENNIKIPRLYTLGFAHNNCGGFCVKAGLKQFKQLYEHFPDRYLYHEERERVAITKNDKLRPFLRKTINKKLIYLTLEEYRVQYLSNSLGNISKEEELEYGGCGCAID